MIVGNIEYASPFIKQLRRLPEHIIRTVSAKEQLFRQNPLHPSLRLHELHGNCAGIWSISINVNYRILFEREENGDILFISIGKHDIYRYL